MNTKSVMVGVGGLLTLFASGCRVSCHFDRDVVVKGSVLEQECEGKIVTSSGRDRRDDRMKIECGEFEIYDGPFKVVIKNDKIKYVAKDWDRDDEERPSITTEIPGNDGIAKAWERDDDNDPAVGRCRYDFDSN